MTSSPDGGAVSIEEAGPTMPSHAPSRHDVLVAELSEVAGGRAGKRRRVPQPTFGASWMWGAAPVLVLAAMVNLIVTQLINQPCRSRGWASPIQFIHLCYSDIPSAVAGAHAPQSPGNWLVVSLVGWLAPPGPNHLRTAVDLLTILIAVAFTGLVVAVTRLAGHRPWDAAMVALSPIVLTAGLISTDLLALAALFGGLALMVPRPGDVREPFARLASAGLLIGLAATFRPVALLALLALAAVCWREGRWPGIGPVAIGAGVGFAVLNVAQFLHSPREWWAYPKSLAHPDLGYGSVMVIPRLLAQGIPADQRDFNPPGWVAFIGVAVLVLMFVIRALLPKDLQQEWVPLNDRGLQAASVLIVVAPALIVLTGPAVLRGVTTAPPGAGAGKVFWAVGSVLVLAGLGWLVARAPRRPRLPVVMLLATVGLMLAAPAIPVQAGLWLVPLLALALPSWRLVLAISVAECLYAGATWLYIYGISEPDRGLPVGWYVVFVVLRLAAWVAAAGYAVRLTRHPELDPVRNRPDPVAGLRDDPAAGLLQHTPAASGRELDFVEERYAQ